MPKNPFKGAGYPRHLNTMELGCALQRLFSTFPNGWPGFGLLLLRVCVGAALIYFGAAAFAEKPSEPAIFTQNLVASLGSLFLLVGLWTPVMGALIAVIEIWAALSLYSPQPEHTWIHIFLAVLSASVAMLGPGAWSIDARLFGRKRFDIDRTRGTKTSL